MIIIYILVKGSCFNEYVNKSCMFSNCNTKRLNISYCWRHPSPSEPVLPPLPQSYQIEGETNCIWITHWLGYGELLHLDKAGLSVGGVGVAVTG